MNEFTAYLYKHEPYRNKFLTCRLIGGQEVYAHIYHSEETISGFKRRRDVSLSLVTFNRIIDCYENNAFGICFLHWRLRLAHKIHTSILCTPRRDTWPYV